MSIEPQIDSFLNRSEKRSSIIKIARLNGDIINPTEMMAPERWPSATLNNSCIYDGEWIDNRRDGLEYVCVVWWKKISRILKKDKRDASGKLSYRKDYICDFSAAAIEEYGATISYGGEWKDGERRGCVVETRLNRDRYERLFNKGKKNRKETFTWSDGSFYIRYFLNGKVQD